MADPKLKQAIAEIRAILNKHDIGAAITLVSDTHAEFYYHLTPSWSVVQIRDTTLHFKSRRKDFKTLKEQVRCTTLSTSMLCQIRDLNAHSFNFMEGVLTNLSKHYHIDHKAFADFTPHRHN